MKKKTSIQKLKHNRRKHGANKLDLLLSLCDNKCQKCGVQIIRMKEIKKRYKFVKYCTYDFLPEHREKIAVKNQINEEWQFVNLATIEHINGVKNANCNRIENLKAYCYKCNQAINFNPKAPKTKKCKFCKYEFTYSGRSRTQCPTCRKLLRNSYGGELINWSLTSSCL